MRKSDEDEQFTVSGPHVNPRTRVGDSLSYFSDAVGGASGSLGLFRLHLKRWDWSAGLLLGVPQFDSRTAK